MMNLVIPSFDLVKRQVLPNKSYSHLLFKGKFFFKNMTKMLKLAKLNVSSFWHVEINVLILPQN